jgi:ribosomal-protein-alanine N-acetyltransferase
VLGEFLVLLSTSRLRLVPLEPAHADPLFEGLRDDRLYEFIPDRPPESVEGLRARYELLVGRSSPDGAESWLNWAVWAIQDSRYIGYVQATVRGDKTADIAYVLFRDAWANGFGREAVAAMAAHLRDFYGVTSLRAVVDPRNARSVRLLQALGFEQTGYRAGADRIRGVPADECDYTLAVPHGKAVGRHPPAN